MNSDAANLIQQIDHALEDGELDEQTADVIVELLTPGASDPWPDIEAVLHLTEHPAVASDLRMHAIPDRLETAIVEALDAVLPLLGIRPYGPTYKIAEIARRRIDAETRKFDIVVDKLEDVADAEAPSLVARYLDTDPAPMFVNRIRRRYPDLVGTAKGKRPAAAEGDLDSVESLGAWVRETLGSDSMERRELSERTPVLGDHAEKTAAAGLASDNPDMQVGGAVLMARFGIQRLVATAVRRVFEGGEAAPLLAVLCGKVAPERVKNAFSQFIAEATWQNPEMPEAELTESRIRAILSARSVLPELGSPMEPLESEELPANVDDESLRAIPGLVETYWDAWDSLLDRR